MAVAFDQTFPPNKTTDISLIIQIQFQISSSGPLGRM